jgi:hypothetical protein
MLLVEPENYKRSRNHSLLADLEAGRAGRLLRLLLGGACIGFIWELLNINARAKWIYTVPGIEELKIFEMPIPGFFGFPPFAVECFILWQALVLAGVAVPRIGLTLPASTSKRVLAAAGAVVFSIGVLFGMERLTVDSYAPRVAELPGSPVATLAGAKYDVFSLASASIADVAGLLARDTTQAATLIEHARIAALRGIGTQHLHALHDLGIHSVRSLAEQDARYLISALENTTGEDLVDARVRVWIRGARHAIERESGLRR